MNEYKLNKSLKWSFENFLVKNEKLQYIIDLAINLRFSDIYIIKWKPVQFKKKSIITPSKDEKNNFDPVVTWREFEWFLQAILPVESDLTTLKDILSDLKSYDYWIWYKFTHKKKNKNWEEETLTDEIRLRLNFENTVNWMMITIRPLINIWLPFNKLTSLDWAINWSWIETKDDSVSKQALLELTKMNTIPELIKADFTRNSWLILVTWSTWEWKSTLVTSILQEIMDNSDKHILTLEDPVEFIFKPKTWKVTQIEIWTHIESFSTWIKWSKRQNPDIVYIAAEGHLYSENPERGVYKTTDGGNSWEKVLEVIDGHGGGHANACGASVKMEDFPEFVKLIKKEFDA